LAQAVIPVPPAQPVDHRGDLIPVTAIEPVKVSRYRRLQFASPDA
jgi:hypothetical protein